LFWGKEPHFALTKRSRFSQPAHFVWALIVAFRRIGAIAQAKWVATCFVGKSLFRRVRALFAEATWALGKLGMDLGELVSARTSTKAEVLVAMGPLGFHVICR